MKVTAITLQQRDHNRVNIMIDGVYRFSLDVFQVGDLGVKIGREYTNSELAELEIESQFGRLYGRTLEYCLMRPHSSKEVRDYLYRKTLEKKYKNKKTGEIESRAGVSKSVTERVFARLADKGYIDDEKFARYWVENRNRVKGISRRKLAAELMAKGIDRSIIQGQIENSDRHDDEELRKIILKKRTRYPDEQKFMQYLIRQGFTYDSVKAALQSDGY